MTKAEGGVCKLPWKEEEDREEAPEATVSLTDAKETDAAAAADLSEHGGICTVKKRRRTKEEPQTAQRTFLSGQHDFAQRLTDFGKSLVTQCCA